MIKYVGIYAGDVFDGTNINKRDPMFDIFDSILFAAQLKKEKRQYLVYICQCL